MSLVPVSADADSGKYYRMRRDVVPLLFAQALP